MIVKKTDYKQLEQEIAGLFSKSIQENRPIFFPPGTLIFIIYILLCSVGFTTLSFLFSSISLPLNANYPGEDLSVILVPLALGVALSLLNFFLVVMALTKGKEWLRWLQILNTALASLTVLASLLSSFHLWWTPFPIKIVALFSCCLSLICIHSKGIYKFTLFFDLKNKRARKST